MNEPVVSVILPTYNRAEFLAAALDSVFAQTCPDFEIIVMDDGSEDETPRLLASRSDPRLRVFRQQNRGVSAARNAAMQLARGRYLALLDSDDLWLPDKLARQVQYMMSGEWEISQTEEIWMRDGRQVKKTKRHAKPEGWFFEKSLEMCLISPSCVMFSRRCWEEAGPFDEEIPACEDYDLWLRVCLRFPVGLVAEPLTVKQGGRPDQLSNSVPFPDIYRIRALIKLLAEEGLTDSQRKAALAELERKGRIYCQGCEKRGRLDESQRFWNLICNALQGKNIPLNHLIA